MQWFSWWTCTVRANGADVECRRLKLLRGSIFGVRIMDITDVGELVWSVIIAGRGGGSLRTADAFPVVASLPPKNSVCEPERQNDFRDVKPF